MKIMERYTVLTIVTKFLSKIVRNLLAQIQMKLM